MVYNDGPKNQGQDCKGRHATSAGSTNKNV